MNIRKLSINQIGIVLSAILVLLSLCLVTVIYIFTESITAVFCIMLYVIGVTGCVVLFTANVRKKLTAFSDSLCSLLDNMMSGELALMPEMEEESLFYKINHRLLRLYEIMQENRNRVAKERADLQELISDISHQVKTPITNLKMVNTTMLQRPMSDDDRRNFLLASEAQIDKLDFLMQSMIKTSRLETGIISLEMKMQPIYDTLAAALGGIVLEAEKKKISVSVNCPEKLIALHDRKWTSEALLNILDNAVKYTPEGGSVAVSVDNWELYLKIDISDTGRGIPETAHGAIFKRFYREAAVHDIDGIGIGLYLSREIIMKQNGYIKVSSEPGHGATFSVFLPNQLDNPQS